MKNKDVDPLYDDAKEFVLSKVTVSASMIQRHVRVSYRRAISLLTTMIEDGIVKDGDTDAALKVITKEVK